MFTFRLDPLITIRDNALKERQAELAKAYEARQILERDLQEIDQQIAEGITNVRSVMQEGQAVNVEHLLGYRRQEMFLRAAQNELNQKMQMIDEAIEHFRLLVVEANKELKVVEKLKEKRYEKYLEEENRAEMKIMDEIAGNRGSVLDLLN
jgi:flagellar FliJ protein